MVIFQNYYDQYFTWNQTIAWLSTYKIDDSMNQTPKNDYGTYITNFERQASTKKNHISNS